MRCLLTGSSGFVGSHVLRHVLARTDWDVICPVTFHHKGLPARIESAVCGHPWQERVRVVHWDMRAPADPLLMKAFRGCDVIMNVASESHVDRSIADPPRFVGNNIDLMIHALELARVIGPKIFLQMSTDEVYGPAYGAYRHKEWDALIPSNPYSASKAAQEALCISYWRTYGVPVVITNTMNIIGEMQSPEKFLPMIIRNLREDQPVTVHVGPDGKPGSRHYLHARNLADAWLFLVDHYAGMQWKVSPYPEFYRPARYHIVGDREIDNVDLVEMVGKVMGTGYMVLPTSFHESRPGHDLRYALDGSKLADLGWKAPVPLTEGLRRTVEWTLEHPEWLSL